MTKDSQVVTNLVPVCQPEPAFAGLQKLLAPGVVEIRADALASAELGDCVVALQTGQNDPDLLFRGVLPAGLPADLADLRLRARRVVVLGHGSLLGIGVEYPRSVLSD
jgi:hypothetical protein